MSLRSKSPKYIPLCLILCASAGWTQQRQSPSNQETFLRVQLDSPAKVKLGAAVHARTIEQVYKDNRLIVPIGTSVTGKVVTLKPVSRPKRLDAISHGDFTPLREATISFEEISVQGKQSIPIFASPAQQGGDVLRFLHTPSKRQSLLRKAWSDFNNRRHEAVGMVTKPGKMERLEKVLYSQLPWHPQQIERGTQYDVALLQPLDLDPVPQSKVDTTRNSAAGVHIVHARLQEGLSSKDAKRDDVVSAVLTQPLLGREGQVEIPQGAVLHGRVLRAQPARGWGKNGSLRFTFNRLDFAQGPERQITGVPTAIDGSGTNSLKLDAEGGVEPETNRGLLLPLTLSWLVANSILDNDGGVGKIAVTSNGFGLITRVIAMSTGSRLVGAAVGSAGAARTIYTRFLAHGREVTFPPDTEVEVETGSTHKANP
jgi:hypothetical protein